MAKYKLLLPKMGESVAEATPETPDVNVPVSVSNWLAPTVIGNVTPLIAVEDFSQSHFLTPQFLVFCQNKGRASFLLKDNFGPNDKYKKLRETFISSLEMNVVTV